MSELLLYLFCIALVIVILYFFWGFFVRVFQFCFDNCTDGLELLWSCISWPFRALWKWLWD